MPADNQYEQSNYATPATGQSWRPEPRLRGPISRLVSRGALTLLGLSMLAALGYFLFAPFKHPTCYFVALVEPSYSVSSGLPIAKGVQDASRLTQLGHHFSLLPWQDDLRPIELASQDAYRELFRQLADSDLSKADALVLYIKAKGYLLDGDPQIVCQEFSTGEPNEGVCAFEDVVDRLTTLRPSTKLIILDIDSYNYDPRLGQIASPFMEAAGEIVRATGRSDLWLITSHSDVEMSQASPALDSSLFNFWLWRGLEGWADQNGSQSIDIAELYQYTASKVQAASDVRSNGFALQQPGLVWGGGATNQANFPVLFSVAGFSNGGADAGSISLLASKTQASAVLDSIKSTVDQDAAIEPSSVPSAEGEAGASLNPQSTQGVDKNESAPFNENKPVADSVSEANTSSETAASNEPSPRRGASQEIDGEVAGETEPRSQDSPSVTEQTRQRIVMAWDAIDRLNQTAWPRPLDAAPHLWRKLLSTCFWYERYFSQTPPENLRPSIVADHQQLVFALNLLADTKRVSTKVHPLCGRIASAWQQTDKFGVADSKPGAQSAKQDLLTQPEQTVTQWATKYADFRHTADPTLRLAFQLAAQEPISEPIRRSSIKLRQTSERLARDPNCTLPLLRQRLLEADSVRLSAERLLFDRTRSDWSKWAEERLEKAARLYASISNDIVTCQAARRLQNDILLYLPYYLELRFQLTGIADGAFRNYRELSTLLANLTQMRVALNSQRMGSINRLVRELRPAYKSLQRDIDRIVKRILSADAPNLAAMQLLVQSQAIDFSQRQAVGELAIKLDQQAWERFDDLTEMDQPVASRTNRTKRLVRAREQLSLEAMLLQYATHRLRVSPEYSKLSTIVSMPTTTATALRAEHDRSTKILAACYAELPAVIKRNFGVKGQQLAVPRQEELQQLLGCLLAIHNVDPRDVDIIEEGLILERLDQLLKREQLSLQVSRLQAEQRDVRTVDAAHVAKILEDSVYQLGRLGFAAPANSQADYPLLIDGINSVALDRAYQADGSLTLRSTAPGSEPVWIVLDYDDQVVEVELLNQFRDPGSLYRWDVEKKIQLAHQAATRQLRSMANGDGSERELTDVSQRVDRLQLAARYPCTPAAIYPAPSLTMEAARSVDLRFRIRRLAGLGAQAKVIVKLVTPTQYLRHEINVDLPKPPTIGIAALGPPSMSSTIEDGILLHPLPNQTTSFNIVLDNQQSGGSTCDLTLLVPTAALPPKMPTGLIDAKQLAEVLATIGPATIAAQQIGVRVPSGEQIPLLPLLHASADASASESATADQPKDGGVPLKTNFGLILRIDNRETGETLLRRILMPPQRPNRYLTSSLAFDASTRQLTTSVEALDPSVIPADGVKVKVTVQGHGAAKSVERTGTVSSPAFKTALHSYVPTACKWAKVEVEVDGYPRAFRFNAPCSETYTALQRQDDRVGVSIVMPRPGTAFRTPRGHIPTTLQVDAPLGAFPFDANGSDFVEIGLDFDRDREFRDEIPSVLLSDRAVHISSKITNLQLQVTANVNDFELNIPSGGAQDLRANLLARITAANRQVWSQPVEILLDGTGPTIERVEIGNPLPIRVDDQLAVRVRLQDDAMSGVAEVQVALDKKFTGILKDQSPVNAKLDSLRYWAANVPLSGVEPGLYDLLIVATDKVGNASQTRRVAIDIQEKLAETAAARANLVFGEVLFDDEPLVDAVVTLTPAPRDGDETMNSVKAQQARTDRLGRYRFPSVQPGEYFIRAEGLARNKPRIEERNLKVSPSPEPPRRVLFEFY